MRQPRYLIDSDVVSVHHLGSWAYLTAFIQLERKLCIFHIQVAKKNDNLELQYDHPKNHPNQKPPSNKFDFWRMGWQNLVSLQDLFFFGRRKTWRSV